MSRDTSGKKYLSSKDVLVRYGRKSTWLYKQIAQGCFPEPIKIDSRNYWDEAVLVDWEDKLQAEAEQRQRDRTSPQAA